MARLFVIIGGLVVVLLTAALVVPYFIDWTTYRAQFEAEASKVLGRPVSVAGPVEARLLPFPSVTFNDIRVASAQGDEPAMTARSFSMDAELAPFLSGEVRIFDMRLDAPNVLVIVDEAGGTDWTLRRQGGLDGKSVILERLRVTRGEVTVRHMTGSRDYRLQDIDAVISARSLSGPWRADGTLLANGRELAASLSTGQPDDKGALRLRLEVTPRFVPAILTADGDVALADGALRYKGVFQLNGRASGALTIKGGDGEPVKMEVPVSSDAPPLWRAKGEFTLDHALLGIDSFRLETGPKDKPYGANGSGFLDLGAAPRFSVEAVGEQVSLDEAAGTSALSLSERLMAIEDAIATMPIPAMPGRIDLSLPAIVTGDTTVRDVAISAEPAAGGWQIQTFSAKLPGRTTLEGKGLLTGGDTPGFKGSMVLAVAQPSGFAAWLARDVDDAIRLLPGAGFSADTEIKRTRQSFANLELQLGALRLTGLAERLADDGAKPSLRLQLDGGALELETVRAFAALFVSDKGAMRLGSHDIDLSLKTGPVTLGVLKAQSLDAGVRLRGEEFEADRLIVSGLEGVNLSATASFSGFPSIQSGKADVSVIGDDLQPLLDGIAAEFPGLAMLDVLQKRGSAFPGLFENAEINALLSLAREDGALRLAISGNGAAGGTQFTASGSGPALPVPGAKANLSLDLANPDAAALLALGGLPALPLGLTGPGRILLTADGDPFTRMQAQAKLTGDDLAAGFDGQISPLAPGFSAKGKTDVHAADLSPWLTTMSMAMPGFGDGFPADLSASAAFDGSALALSELTGTLGGSAVSGAVTLRGKGSQLQADGALDLDVLDTGWLTEALYGGRNAQGEGWSDAAFAQSVRLPFTGKLAVTAKKLLFAGLPEISDAGFEVRLGDDGAAVSGLKGAMAGGALTGLGDIRNSGASGILTTQFALKGADAAVLYPAAGVSGKADLAASLSASGKSEQAMAASLSGSGSLALENPAFSGLNPRALQPILDAVDAAGPVPSDTATLMPMIRQMLAAGTFAAPRAETALTLAGGVLRMAEAEVRGEGAAVKVTASLDAASLSLDVVGEFAFDPGLERLAGSEPVIRFAASGPANAPVVTLDASPLGQFLTQRALEREQARVEAMQALLGEKQRLRREARYFAFLETERQRAADDAAKEAAERLKAEEDARLKAEQAAKAEEAAKLKAEEDARSEAEAIVRQAKAKDDAKKAAEAARKAADEKAAAVKAAEKAPVAKAADNNGAKTAQKPDAELPLEAVPAEPAADAFPEAPKKKGLFGGQGLSLGKLLKDLGGGD